MFLAIGSAFRERQSSLYAVSPLANLSFKSLADIPRCPERQQIELHAAFGLYAMRLLVAHLIRSFGSHLARSMLEPRCPAPSPF